MYNCICIKIYCSYGSLYNFYARTDIACTTFRACCLTIERVTVLVILLQILESASDHLHWGSLRIGSCNTPVYAFLRFARRVLHVRPYGPRPVRARRRPALPRPRPRLLLAVSQRECVPPPPHTHTHTHTQPYTHTHAHPHLNTRIRTYPHPHTHTHGHITTSPHYRIQTHIHTYIYKHKRKRTRTKPYIQVIWSKVYRYTNEADK